jgi:hypothetical protein
MDAVAEHGHSHPASRRPRKPTRPGRDAKQDCSRTSPSTAFSWIRLPLRHREQEHDDNAAALSLLVRSEHLVEPGLSSRSPRGEAAAGPSYWRRAGGLRFRPRHLSRRQSGALDGPRRWVRVHVPEGKQGVGSTVTAAFRPPASSAPEVAVTRD